MSKKFETFSKVKDVNLRVWNRATMFFNIMSDHGREPAIKYVKQFEQQEIKDILSLFKRIEVEGYSKVRAEINRNLVPEA